MGANTRSLDLFYRIGGGRLGRHPTRQPLISKIGSCRGTGEMRSGSTGRRTRVHAPDERSLQNGCAGAPPGATLLEALLDGLVKSPLDAKYSQI